MTQGRLTSEVQEFLRAHFPGSSINDGYSFISVESRVRRYVKDAPFDLLQRVADRLSEAELWLICVGADPRPFVRAAEVEERTVIYTPDWNVEQKLIQWLASVEPSKVDLFALLSALVWPAALVLIDPSRRIIFDARMRRVYGASVADLRRFFEGIEDTIETQ